MNPVTDPSLLEELNADAGPVSLEINGTAADMKPVEDPALLEQLDGPGIAPAIVDAEPDKVARARQVARLTGLPEGTVERNLELVEKRYRLDELRAAAETDPAIANILADPATARVAHDDVENLSRLSQAGASFARFAGAIAAAVPQINAGLWGVLRAGADVVGADSLAGYAAERAGEQQGFVQSLNPSSGDHWQDIAYTGLTSAGQSLMMAPLGMAGLLTGFGLTSGGSAYSQARDAGKDVGESLGFAASQGVIEAGTEMLPAGAFLKMLRGGSGPAMAQAVKQFIAKEAIGEQVATALQDLNEWVVLNPEKTFDDYLRARPGAAAETLLATIVSVGASTTAAQALEANRERAQRATDGGKQLAELMRASAASQTRARDPEAFRNFLADATENATGEESTVFIDGRQFAQALAQSGVDFNEMRAKSPELVQQMIDAVETGGDVEIPVADFATAFAGTPAGEVLIGHVRTSVDAMSAAEAAEFAAGEGEFFQQEMDRALANAQGDEVQRAGETQVRDRLVEQLRSTGRYTEEVNSVNAQIATSLYTSMAAKMGVTPEQMFERFPLRIVGENPAAPGEVLRATDDPQFGAWFGESKVVDESGAPLVVYHATDSKFNVFDHAKVGSNHPAYAKRGFFFYKAKRSATERALEFGRAGRLKRVYLSLQNPLTVVARSKGSAEEWFDRNSDSLYSRAEAMGADGIVVKVNPESRDHTADDIYVAFHPEQIKSVFNRGTWDGNDPNILNHRAPSSRFEVRREKKKKKTGRYVGAPEWFERGRPVEATPEALEAESGDAPFMLEDDGDFAGEWRVARVPISEIDAGVRAPSEDTPARLDEIRAAPDLFRPIYEIGDDGRARIIDGWHRLQVAKERGESEVEALVVRRRNDPNVLNQRAPSSRYEVRREKKTGRYVGAPDWVGASSAKLGALTTKLKQLAQEGIAGKFWYEDSARAVMEITGGDPVEAEKFIGLLAIYSQGTDVSANVTFALTAYYQWKAGLPINTGRFPAAQSAKAEAILRRNEGWGGVKTNNFYNDLMEEIDPSKMDESHATMDMWMALAFDYGATVLDQGPKYKFAKAIIEDIARQMGLRPHQVQAMIWTAIKFRVESTEKKRREIERKKGIQVQAEDGSWVVPTEKAYDHFRLAHKLAMEMPLDQGAMNASVYDFGHALRERMVQISWEATPSTTEGRSLPGIHAAPLQQKFEYLAAVRQAITDENGRDIIADMVGLPQGSTVEGVSAWAGAVGAGAQTMVPVTLEGAKKSRTIRPVAKDILDLYSAIRGYVLEQDAVVYHTPVWDDAKSRHNGVHLSTPRPLHPEEVQMLYSALQEKFGTWDLAPGWRPDGARVLNFVEGLDNKAFREGLDEVIDNLPEDFGGGSVTTRSFRSEGDYIGNDWQENPNGEAYLSRVQAGRPDLLGRVADLRARIEAVNAEFVARYGWDRAETEVSSGPERAGDGRAVQPATLTGESPPVGVHFSHQHRPVLDGRYYGTGIRGREAERVLSADDARLKERVYFYIDTGRGVRREVGLGVVAHEVDLPELYDASNDPLSLGALAGNDFESAVLDAGFHGYFVREIGSGNGMAVVMGAASRELRTRAVESPEQAAAANAAPARYTTLLRSAVADAITQEQLATVRAVAPSARLRGLSFAVDAAELPAAREALARIGVELPEESLNQSVFHGSPHVFTAFSFDHIGTGEGAQVFGWGLYFAESRGAAHFYHNILSGGRPVREIKLGHLTFGEKDSFDYTRRAHLGLREEMLSSLAEQLMIDQQEWATKPASEFQQYVLGTINYMIQINEGDNEILDALRDLRRTLARPGAVSVEFGEQPGGIYKVEIPDEALDRMLLWDKPLSEQPEAVKQALQPVIAGMAEWNHNGITYPARGNLSGEGLYGALERQFKSQTPGISDTEAARQASEYLASLGIPGNRYLDGLSRGRGEDGTYNVVVWDQALLDEMNAQMEMEVAQRAEAPRGTFNPSTNTIALLEKADLSTFLHELGHFGLEMMVEIASQPGAPRTIVDDVLVILDWFGVDSIQSWNAMSLDEKRPHHEKFAEGFETYLFEGKAPSIDLSGPFMRVRAWLINVYKSLTSMRVQLTDDVRAVFDRMLATNEQIAEQSRARNMAPLFENAEQAGMTPEDWRAYQETGAQAARDAVTDLQARTLRDMRWLSNAKGRALKKLQDSAKEIRKGVRAEVTEQVDTQPVYAALRFIEHGAMAERDLTNAQRAALDTVAGGKTKLALPVLKDLYGEGPSAPWRYLKQTLVAAEGGAHPDAIAAAFGFDSGDALVRAILAAEPRQQLIDGLTDRRMLEEHGDLSDPVQIELAAETAIHNEARIRFVATETKALQEGMNAREQVGKTRSKPPRALTVNTLVRAAAQYAEAIVGRTVVRKLNPTLHARTAAREAKAAAEAMRAGDLQTALSHKRNQLLHERTSRAMTEARVEAEKAHAYLSKFRRSNRARGAIDGDYVEQIENILALVDTRNSTNRRLESLQSLREWAAKQEAEGLPVVLDTDTLQAMEVTNVRDMKMEDLRALVDQVKSIEHLGKLKKKLLTARDQREFDEIAESLAASIREHGGKKREMPFAPGAAEHDTKRSWRSFFAEHRKLASFARQMDGVVDDGPMWRVFIRGMNDAGNRETSLIANSTRALADIFKPILKLKGGTTGDKRLIPALGKSLSRGERLAVVLNWGNELSRQRVLNTVPAPAVEQILATFTRAEAKAIQQVWDHVNGYWPDIAAKEKRVTGVVPEKVEAAPFTATLADGSTFDFAGGYYPIVYESEMSDVAAAHEQGQIAKDMLAGAYTRSTTRRGHTKKRAEKVGEPLRFTLDVIDRHLAQVVHDLSWHEWLIDTGRILRDKRITSAIREHYGNEALQAMRRSMDDIATGDLQRQGQTARIAGALRARVSAAMMGWSMTTALLQPFGLFQSIPRVGSVWIARGMKHWVGDMARFENSAKLIREKSEMMRHRSTTFNRDIREVTARVHKGKGVAREVFDASIFVLMQKLQLVADIPTWWGAYEKALAQDPHDEGRAVALADQAVLDAQGSGTVKDLAGVQRGGEIMKSITMFYSYFSATHQLVVESTAKTNFRNPAQVAGWLADMVLLSVVPVLAQQLVFSMLRGGDDDDKDWDERLVDFSKELGAFWLNTVILVREFSGAVQGFNYDGPAGFRALVEGANLVGAAKKAADPDKELTDNDYRRALKSVMTVLGLPAAQIDRSWRGWQAWQEGEAGPGAVLMGPPPKD